MHQLETNMSYKDLKTKKEKLAYIKQMLSTNDRWMLKGLYTIFLKQTSQEQASEVTQDHNGVGFTGADANILTSFAKQFVKKGGVAMLVIEGAVTADTFFSPKQLPILRKKMPKYARQLMELSH